MSEVINQTIPLKNIVKHPRNYNQHPEKQLARLQASLIRFGQVRSVVVQAGANNKFLLVAGHGIMEAAQREDITNLRADVIPADWTPEQVDGYLLADNMAGASPDQLLLTEMLQEQANGGYLLESVGYSQKELDGMLEVLAQKQLETIDLSSPEPGSQKESDVDGFTDCPKCGFKFKLS